MSDETVASSRIKIWITAVRPFAYTASLLPVLLGLALAFSSGFPIRWGLFALTLIGVLSIHTAANLLNDCFDHRRGLDVEVLPMSGAVVRGWLSERQVWVAAMVFLGVGVACGLALTYMCGWVVMAVGLVGTIIALAYTRSGFCFKYNGFGDAAIFVAFGVLPVFGAYWVQTQTFSWRPILWSVPLCCYTVAILHANNWHDIDRDREADCSTFAGILGKSGSAIYYRTLILGPYVLVIGAVALARWGVSGGWAPITATAMLLSLPLAVKLALIRPDHDTAAFDMLDGSTAQLHMAFGIMLVAGLFVGQLV